MQHENELVSKVAFSGRSEVGKSRLYECLKRDSKPFSADYHPTVGVEFSTRFVELNNGKTVKYQFWDTAGAEHFAKLVNAYFRNCDVIYLVYDMTNRDSFTELPTLVQHIQTNAGAAKIALIANKCDCEDVRQVDSQEGRAFAQRHGFDYFEISAKTQHNVAELLAWTCEQVVQKYSQPTPLRYESFDIPLNDKSRPQRQTYTIDPSWTTIHNHLKNFAVWRKLTTGVRPRPTGIGKLSRTLFFSKRIGDEALLRRFYAYAQQRLQQKRAPHRQPTTAQVYTAICDTIQPLADIEPGQQHNLDLSKMVSDLAYQIGEHVQTAAEQLQTQCKLS